MKLLDSQYYLYPRPISPTAAILLDVENFCLKLDLEQYLKTYCLYPITIKLAVANWQNSTIAHLDSYLHQQRYQLIHVPKAKNSADGQILTLGASLLLQYPQITEIVVVSRDAIFDYLHQILPTLGCKTYKVYQEANNIYIHNFIDNRTDRLSIPSSVIQQDTQTNKTTQISCQDPKKLLQNKIELTLKKLNSSSVNPVTISSLSQEYKKEYQKSLSEAIKGNKLGGSIIKFLKNNCTDKINIEQQNNNYYLALKNDN